MRASAKEKESARSRQRGSLPPRYEAGVYLRFVVDHYDDLPELTVFVQARARVHRRAHVQKLTHRFRARVYLFPVL